MQISVVIPAHNEEQYIGRCLDSIKDQRLPSEVSVEVVVVLNRCTDATEDIAKSFGATLVVEDAKNISAIKNAGVAASCGEWVVTIDADSWMSPGVLATIYRRGKSSITLGGGIKIKSERLSPGIAVGYGMMLVPAFFLGLSFGLYWFRKPDFDAILGFDEKRHIAEDVDFLRRLKAHGRRTGRNYEIITSEFVTTSCRKFDQFGDWHFVRAFGNPLQVLRGIAGTDREYLDKHWYETRR